MRAGWIVSLLITAAALAGCATAQGPTATCFNLMASETPCKFQPVLGEPDGGA